MIHPNIYRICASACGIISGIPLDILQTNIVSEEKVTFKLNELKLIFLTTIIFTSQNIVFEYTRFIPNKSIRGLLSGVTVSPIYILLESSKIKNRLGLYPIYKNIIFWLTFRQILFYITLYNLLYINVRYSKILSPLFANFLGFPLKIIALKKSYPIINYSTNKIKNIAAIEIVKSSFSDCICLYLIYNAPFSPLKINNKQ
jgi:hypothetical protein